MYFGGMNGLTVFHPDSIREDDYQPPIVLTAFKLFNTPVTVGQQYDGFVLPQSITDTDELILSYRESVFTLEFSALMFSQPMKHTYAYRLEGFDKDWNYTNAKRRFATYTNLDPGTYTFHVKGSNHDGVWNEYGRTLKIIITPPWWETWWFRALLIVGIISVLMLAYKYRVRQIIKIEKLRADIASDLHDEVGSSLGSIALMTERMAIHPSFENQEREKLLTISGVARRTLEAMSDIVWAIQPYVGRRDDFFLRIKEITAELLTQEHLTYRLHLPEKGAPLSMLIRKNTVLIYKEILHNILKHSKASHVLIDIALHGHAMYWTIQDNGIGMNNPIKTGNGMKNMKKRAEALGGTIEFSSEQGQGVTIKLVCQLSS
ncbi:hypothetical protein HUU42_06620 [bacterium]|nr:hypothetical protein [bacterium]